MNKGKRPTNRQPRNGQKRPKYNNKHKSRGNNRYNAKLEIMKKEKLALALEKQKAGKKLNIFEARLILEQPKS